MTEANKDVEGAIENNEQEMIDEGAPVQPSTDPVLGGGDDDPAGTEGGDSSDEESDSSGEADAADADVAGAELSDAEVQDAVDAEADDAGTATDADGAVEEPVSYTHLRAHETN